MGEDFKIRETCMALKEAGFPFDIEGTGGSGILTVDDQGYDTFCQITMKVGINLLRERFSRFPQKTWNPTLINIVEDFTKKHGIKVVVHTPLHPSSVMSPLSVIGSKTLVIGLGNPIVELGNESALLFALDHEYGHMRDREVVAHFHPEIKQLGMKRLSNKDFVTILNAFLDVIRKNVREMERERFDMLFREIFGDYRLDTDKQRILYWALTEILRYGEEIGDPRLRDIVMSEDFMGFKLEVQTDFHSPVEVTTKKGKKIDLNKLALVAKLHEAGLWEEFRTRKGIDPIFPKGTQSEYVDFFRIGIRAAKVGYKSIK